MPVIDSQSWGESAIGGPSIALSPVSGVNAHLRIHRDAGDFRVVVTFHRADGSLCEAELTPSEAIGLKAEIGRVVDQGDSGRYAAINKQQDIPRD